MGSSSTDETTLPPTESSSVHSQENFGPLDHLSAEQVESIYQQWGIAPSGLRPGSSIAKHFLHNGSHISSVVNTSVINALPN